MNHLCRLSLCAAIAMAMALSSLAAPWTGGRGSGNRGAFPNISFPQAPAVVWKAYLGKEFVDITPSNAILAGKIVVVAYDKYLLGLIADTGELRWQQTLTEPPLDDLLYLDDQIIISQTNGTVAAYDPATGKQVWKRDLPGGLRNGPVYTDTYFLFATKSHTIEGVERKTGKHLGTTDTQDKIEAAPAIFGKSLVLAYGEGNVKRIDETLTNRWSYLIPNAIISLTPVTDGKIVLVNAGNILYALNPLDRMSPVRWTYSISDRLSDPVTLDDNRIYIAAHSNRLFAVDALTGKNLPGWSGTVTTTEGGKEVKTVKPGIELLAPPVGSPLVFGDSLLVRMESGLLALYDKQKGTMKWLYRMIPPTGFTAPKTAMMGTPAIDGNDIYFAGNDGNIYHLSAKAPDLDPPTFTDVLPQVAEKGYIDAKGLLYAGAVINDEGTGVQPAQITMKLDREDLSAKVKYLADKNFYYYQVPTTTQLRPGMHRLLITATDNRGNVGTLKKDFIVASETAAERLVVRISGEFVPKHLYVKPGSIVVWNNDSGSPRTVVADEKDIIENWHLSSDEIYADGIPNGDYWVWIVPTDAELGSKLYYHCRIKGQPGDGNHFGKGLTGLIEIGQAPPSFPITPEQPAATPPTTAPADTLPF